MGNLPTSLIWHEYDGNNETLPVPIKKVLLRQTQNNIHEYNVVFLTSYSERWLLFYTKENNAGYHGYTYTPIVGDCWAYLED
jgi:hypothetical protein